MNELAQAFGTTLLPSIAGFILGPVATWAAKTVLDSVGTSLGPRTKILMSSIAGGIAALGAGNPNALAQAIADFIQGAIAGFGGSKARDYRAGKTIVITPAEAQEAGIIPRAPVG